ncbi:portal protein [Brevibacillus sp. AG]|uniref:portal protein n=1 Tax=Brevibacillus sp. AG TaxID=3020891 RepID=UPI00232F9EE8|nr:portal protein [Brevibacillus sp. AG]MDC0763505.1 portal protein [Brevibacillus sp. AG]
MGLLEKIQSIWRRGSPSPNLQSEGKDRPDATPMTHSTSATNETDYLYKTLQVEGSRRAVLRDVEQMLHDDPLIDETNARIARKAVRGGILVTVTGSGNHSKNRAVKTGDKAGRGAHLANRAQDVIDSFIKRTKIEATAVEWISRLIADGDLFLNVVVKQGPQPFVEAIRRVPPAIMKRNEDQFGQFVDLSRAFSEIDPSHGLYFLTTVPETAVRHFPLWAINHIRWKYRGGLYGTSQYMSIRKLSNQNRTADDDMVIRRKTRAPLRRVHSIGTKDNPGDETTIKQYKAEHRDTIENGRYKPTTDYYHNGIGDVKNLEGDGNLDKIGDVEYLFNKENAGTLIPKGLIGFSENINRDVLDDQKDEYYDTIEDIRSLLEYGDGGPFSGLRSIIDFELLLHGIDVEATGLSYDISFNPLRTEKPQEVLNRTVNAYESKLIDLRTAVNNVAHIFQVEDAEQLLLSILVERSEQQQSAPQSKGTKEPDDPDGAITDSEEDEDDTAHLYGLDEVEEQGIDIWRARFQRLAKKANAIQIDFQEVMTDAEEKSEIITVTPDGITKFLRAVASMHQVDATENRVDLGYLHTRSGEIGGTLASARIGLNFELFKEDILDDLLHQSATRVKNIDSTTEKRLREALAEGYLTGDKREVRKKVEEALGKVYGDAYENRAEMIARTETMWAYNQSALRTYERHGVDTSKAPALPAHTRCRCAYAVEDGKIIILVTSDERTCPRCRGFIGQSY